jgi:uncharacterized protein (DUF305 family)
MKSAFLALTLVAIASTTACSNISQNQVTPTTSATDTSATSHMGHGSSMVMLGPADANYDLRFIDGMRSHHQGAVAMAKLAQQKSQHPEIKQLADNIIKTQTKEIAQMQQWRQAWYPQASKELVAYGGEGKSVIPMSEQQSQSMKMVKYLGAADPKFDLRFMDAMLAHHEGALTMAQNALAKSKRPEVKQLAQDIITSQQAEIDQMKQWRQAWYKQ